LKTELEKAKISVLASDFPDNDLARERYWLRFLKNSLKANEESVLVDHSSGAVAALRFAEQYKILGSVLVGVYYTDLGLEKETKSGYFGHPWNWEAIKTIRNGLSSLPQQMILGYRLKSHGSFGKSSMQSITSIQIRGILLLKKYFQSYSPH
jgi:uncharacterized protein